MKISDIASQISAEYKSENKKNRPDGPEEKQKTEGRTGDKVEISSQSRDLQKMKEMVRTAPEGRAELIQELKQKIDSGEYKVDSKELASKMLSDLLEEQSLLPK